MLTVYASEPDVVAELLAVANELETTPRSRTDACHLIHEKVVAGRRVRKLALRIEVVAPGGPVRMRPPVRARRGGEQMSLGLEAP